MAPAPALLLPGVGVTVARPAPAAAALADAVALPLRLRPARAHFVLAAARTPPRSVSVRCAPKTGSFVGGVATAPSNNIHGPALKRAAADAFRPVLDNFDHVRPLKNLADANDYNIGMCYDCRCYAVSADGKEGKIREFVVRICFLCVLLQRSGYFDKLASRVDAKNSKINWQNLVKAALLVKCLIIGYLAAVKGDERMTLLITVIYSTMKAYKIVDKVTKLILG